MLSYMEVGGNSENAGNMALAHDVYLAIGFAHHPVPEYCPWLRCIILNSRGSEGSLPFPGTPFMF